MAGARKRRRPPRRDYAAEYARRKARGLAAGLSVSAARGHAREGEVGPAELRQLRRAVDPQRGGRWRGSRLRDRAARSVAAVAGVDRDQSRVTGESFVAAAMRMGISRHEAWTLWFSP